MTFPRNNSLFHLERSLFPDPPPASSEEPKKSADPQVQAMAFDFDEAIELRYDGNTYTANAFSFSNAYEDPIAFEVESFGVESNGYPEESAAFEVESFGVSPSQFPGANQPARLEPLIPPGAYVDPPNFGPNNAVNNAVNNAANPPAPPLHPSQPNLVPSVPPPASQFSVDPSDDEVAAFAADLQAILSGAKFQEGGASPPPEEPAYPPVAQAQSQALPAPEPLPPARPHAVFDQMTENMAYANAFDLGTLSLEQRFDAFDRALDQETATAFTTTPASPSADPNVRSQWVTPFSIPEPIAYAASDEAWSLPFDFDTADLVENFGTTSGSSGESFDMRYEVPLIPQQTAYSAWTAAAAMLVAWRDEMPLNLNELAQGAGPWALYKSALQTEDPNFFKVWGLATKPAQTLTVDSFVQLIMDTFGPIWVAADPPGSRARVITGVYGDGTPEGTYVLINDPWATNMTSFQMPNSGAKYQESYQQFMQKQLSMTRQGTPAKTLYVAYLQNPVGKALLAEVEANED